MAGAREALRPFRFQAVVDGAFAGGVRGCAANSTPREIGAASAGTRGSNIKGSKEPLFPSAINVRTRRSLGWRLFYRDEEDNMGFGKGALLWMLGIPLPIILLLALFMR